MTDLEQEASQDSKLPKNPRYFTYLLEVSKGILPSWTYIKEHPIKSILLSPLTPLRIPLALTLAGCLKHERLLMPEKLGDYYIKRYLQTSL